MLYGRVRARPVGTRDNRKFVYERTQILDRIKIILVLSLTETEILTPIGVKNPSDKNPMLQGGHLTADLF